MKKIISCMLIMLLLCMTTNIVLATESNTSPTSFLTDVNSTVAAVLSSMEMYKAQYGMENINFSTLSLGSELPAYEITSNGAALIEDIHYFPIMSNNSWVATAIVCYGSEGSMNVEVSKKYVDAFVSRTERISPELALVFDNSNTYLFNGANYTIAETNEPISSRAPISSLPTLNLDTVPLASNSELTIRPSIMTRANGDAVFLDVPSIMQPTNQSCWATSTASILQYYGLYRTPANVCSAANVNLNTYLSAADTAELIGDYYGFGWGKNGDTNTFYYKLIMDTLITETYINDSPIFAGFAPASNSSTGAGHAVVVQGYVNLTYPTMSYMDPADGLYKASNVPSNGDVAITVSGTSRSLLAAFAVYE